MELNDILKTNHFVQPVSSQYGFRFQALDYKDCHYANVVKYSFNTFKYHNVILLCKDYDPP